MLVALLIVYVILCYWVDPVLDVCMLLVRMIFCSGGAGHACDDVAHDLSDGAHYL